MMDSIAAMSVNMHAASAECLNLGSQKSNGFYRACSTGTAGDASGYFRHGAGH